MNTDRNIIKWHYVTNREGSPAGLRGWDARLKQRYEMTDTPAGWEVVIVEFGEFDGLSDFNNARYRHLATGTLFDCMVAAEKEANALYTYEMQQPTAEEIDAYYDDMNNNPER